MREMLDRAVARKAPKRRQVKESGGTNKAGIGRHHGVDLGIFVLVVDERSLSRIGVDLGLEGVGDTWVG
jgi:hypothetical protein